MDKYTKIYLQKQLGYSHLIIKINTELKNLVIFKKEKEKHHTSVVAGKLAQPDELECRAHCPPLVCGLREWRIPRALGHEYDCGCPLSFLCFR